MGRGALLLGQDPLVQKYPAGEAHTDFWMSDFLYLMTDLYIRNIG